MVVDIVDAIDAGKDTTTNDGDRTTDGILVLVQPLPVVAVIDRCDSIRLLMVVIVVVVHAVTRDVEYPNSSNTSGTIVGVATEIIITSSLNRFQIWLFLITLFLSPIERLFF